MRLCMIICLLCAVVFCFGQSMPENKTTATEEQKHSATIAEGLLQQPKQLHHYLHTITRKVSTLNQQTEQQTLRVLRRMQRKELRLAKKLQSKIADELRLIRQNNFFDVHTENITL